MVAGQEEEEEERHQEAAALVYLPARHTAAHQLTPPESHLQKGLRTE